MGAWLKRKYEAEPAIINALGALVVAIAAKFGLDLDWDQVVPIIFGAGGVATVATRQMVWAPDTHRNEVARAKANP
jgi:hypothetical protein